MQICNTEVNVEYVELFDGHMGRSSIKEARIVIDQNMPEMTQEKCLIHEVIHYISECNHLELSETQVSALAVGMHGFIVDNPETLREIMK